MTTVRTETDKILVAEDRRYSSSLKKDVSHFCHSFLSFVRSFVQRTQAGIVAILFFNSSWILVGTRMGYFCKLGG
jgi:hypothetical protein